MARHIDLEVATNKEREAFLLDYWHIDSLSFVAEYHYDEVKQMGIIDNVYSKNGKRVLKYPIINNRPVRFKFPQKFSSSWCSFNCVIAPKKIREATHNPFALSVVALSPINKPDFIELNAENNNRHTKNQTRVPKTNDYSNEVDLPINNKDKTELGTIRWRLNLRNLRFIAQFKACGDEYEISDVRRSDFSKLIMHNMEQLPPFKATIGKKIRDGYYEFTWKILHCDLATNEYLFTVDENFPIVGVSPIEIVEKLHENIMGEGAPSAQRTVRSIDTLKTQLIASGKEIFIYELLQNANDYPQIIDSIKQPVDVEFHITDKYLIFMHTGAVFSERNIAAICDINDKDKTDNTDTIGYKGIGFKTVFVDNNYVYLSTGRFHLRFDWEYSKNRVSTPWQLLPIWTDISEVDDEVLEIFKKTYKRFPVQFALRPTNETTLRQSEQNFVRLFKDVFANERVILFIPYINSVKVFFHDDVNKDIVKEKNNDQWVVNTYKDKIKEETRKAINKEIDDQKENGTLKIPTKYYNFKETSVSFACARNGVELCPVEDALLYCYLPAKKASWGLKFLMNTDMIPTGPRDDIAMDLDVNKEIAKIAGEKFFEWILELCREQKYKIDTIYQLIPNFDDCKNGVGKNYKDLIEQFEKGFEDRLLNEEFIPIGGGMFKKISDIILDETGFSSKGAIKDSDYIRIASADKFLPIGLLRSNKDFNVFLKRYLIKFGFSSNIWSKANLVQAITLKDMVDWLKIQENNNAFLKFLLDKKWLADVSTSAIFVCADGNLHPASTIYNDKNIFDKINYLKCFESLIPHLTTQTVEYFKDDEEWNEQTKGLFTALKSKSFVTGVLLNAENKENTIKELKVKSNSLSFYSFLAKYVNLVKDDEQKTKDESTINILKELPFFGFIHSNGDDNDVVIDTFNKFILLYSPEAKAFVERIWVNNSWITFVSKDYNKEVIDYLKNFFGVKSYSDSLVVCHFIRPYISTKSVVRNGYLVDEQSHVKSPFCDLIIANIQNKEASIDFFSFCFACKTVFEKRDLYEYPLLVKDRDDEEIYLHRTEQRRYFDVPEFSIYSNKEWIEKGWMYKLDNCYLDIVDCNDKEQFEAVHAFYQDICGVVCLTARSFCFLISSVYFKEILKITTIPSFDESQKEDIEYINEYEQLRTKAINANVDFIRFVDDNIDIFKDKETNALPLKFESIVINDGLKNIPLNKNTYFTNTELHNIIKMTWFPPTLVVNIANDKYGSSSLLTALGVKDYTFSDFYEEFICTCAKTISSYINDFERNKDFHKFMMEHVTSITPEKLTLLSQFPIYVIGDDSQESGTTGSTLNIPAVVKASLSGHKILSSTVTELFEKKLVKASDLDIIHPDYRPDENFDSYWSKFDNVRFESSHFVEWLFSHKQTFSTTVSKTNENIEFWRWAKANIADNERLGELNFLPVIVLPLPSESSNTNTANTTQDTFKALTNTIYASNHYMANEDIESFVKLNDKNALFVSDKYLINQETPESITAWMDFWKKVGVKNDYLSIITNTIIRNLSSIKNENLPILFAQYEAELRKQYTNLPSTLSSMLVKTADGIYRKMSSTVYINTNTSEPFPYIAIPNSISFVGKEHNVSALMLQIATAANATVVNTPLDWRKAKLKRYSELQTIKEKIDNSLSNANIVVTDEEKNSVISFDSIHFALLKDLASIKANKNDSITDLETSISSLKLYSNAGVLTLPKALTVGSVYNPLCDYQLCGITEGITYISDKYADIDNINSLIDGTLRVRSGFGEKEIPLLEKYPKFARYFWETFLAKNIAGYSNAQKTILGYFRDRMFSTVACIPTEKSVKKPEELYYGNDVDEFVDRLPNYKEKIPAVADIVFEENGQKVSLFSLLPFKSDKLTLQDCFDALVCYNDQKRRPKLLSWIVAQFNKEDSKHIAIRGAYRDNSEAKWISGDNETKRIDELYALDEPNGKLSFYFGSHPKVFNTNYFPKGEEYLKACECLAIRVIHDNTADMETVHVKSNTPDMTEESLKQYLQMAVLILAGIESAPNWEPAYNAYLEEISKMKFVCCESIILRYKNDNSISTDTKRFYHQSGTDTFMYVDNYKDPRLFTDFVGELMLCLKIKADKDIVLNLLYDKKSALAEIEKRNQLKSDEKFMQFMEAYDSGISSRLKGKKADETPIEVKTEHKSIEVKDQVSETHIENEYAPHDENTNNSHEQPSETESTNEESQKENVSANEKASTESQQDTDAKTETTLKSNQQSTKSKPSYERLDPNKYKRREMKVGTQNPKTMGINRIISDEEKRQLSEILGRAMEVDTIMNENYIVRLRFYNEVVKKYGGAKMDIQEFVQNKHSVLESGSKFIHRCSARGGTLYISPSIWNLLAKDGCVVCMYYGKYADDFIFIESQEELMQMIDQDAIVIQVTGNDKKNIVNKVYEDDILSELNTNGNVYTLIRTIKEDNSQLVYTSPDDIPINSYSDEDVDPDMF